MPVATPECTQTCTQRQRHRRSHHAHKATRLEPTTDKAAGFRGNKTVNPLLTASAARRGWPHIMQKRGAALSLQLASRSRRSLCQPDSKLFYASGALIFHTVSSHDSLFPQRKIAGMEKKKKKRKKRRTPCDRLVHCAAEFRLQAEGDEGRGRAKMETAHSGGVCMLASQRGNVGL